ncbi:STAS domain-containing protein [Streptomyces kanasensis]|uniref:STAS domain-containing protein n=1 Tax=Streptomyces kanasensis TaxID=936756 RepID=UPI0036FDCA60
MTASTTTPPCSPSACRATPPPGRGPPDEHPEDRHPNAPTGPVLKVVGDLDHATAGEPRARVTTLTLQPGRRLVLDLRGLAYGDSSGVSAPIVIRNHALAAADVALAEAPTALRASRALWPGPGLRP